MGRKQEIIHRSKPEACVAVVHFLEIHQRYPVPVSIKTSWTRTGQDERGRVRLLCGPEVRDFFYDERIR